MNIYISNLSNETTVDDLKNLFTPFGEVDSSEVVEDAFTGKPRGFGYVQMNDDTAAEKAIAELNNSELKSSKIAVEQAKPKEVMKGSYKVGSGAVNVYRFRKN